MSGFYIFRWDHPASEVFVTGTFDGWSKSTKLEKSGDAFVKKVELPAEKVLYKFVVDGDWVIDPNAPLETDSSGIQNNILSAQTIQKAAQQDMPPATISSVNPESTTAALAAVVPKEDEPPVATLSSVAPDSSTAALAGQVPLENAAPGTDAPAVETADPASPAPATASVPDDNQIFSVNPLPASDTAENPISLQPGEPVPKNIGTQSLHSNVRLDKESYERGATNFPLDVVTPADLGVSSLPKNLIPESSLPITSASEAAAAKPKPAEVPAKPEPERQPFVRENVVAAEAAVPSSAAVVDKKDKAEVQPAPAVATANGSGNGIKPTPPKAEPVMAAPTEPVSNGQHPKTSTEAGRASVGSSSKKNKRRSFFGVLLLVGLMLGGGLFTVSMWSKWIGIELVMFGR